MTRRPPFLVDGDKRLAPHCIIKLGQEVSADQVAEFRRRWDEALATDTLLEVYVLLPRGPSRLGRLARGLWEFLT